MAVSNQYESEDADRFLVLTTEKETAEHIPGFISEGLLTAGCHNKRARRGTPGDLKVMYPPTSSGVDIRSAETFLGFKHLEQKYLDPTWVLRGHLAEHMTNTAHLKTYPVLNLLNGFESVMEKMAFLYADTQANLGTVDNVNYRTEGDSFLASRILRMATLVLGYGLVDILMWKGYVAGALNARVAQRDNRPRVLQIPHIPSHVDYGRIALMIQTRVVEVVEAGAGGIAFMKRYSYKVLGSFFEVFLGGEISVLLEPVIQAEYMDLIETAPYDTEIAATFNVKDPKTGEIHREENSHQHLVGHVFDLKGERDHVLNPKQLSWVEKERKRPYTLSGRSYLKHGYLAQTIYCKSILDTVPPSETEDSVSGDEFFRTRVGTKIPKFGNYDVDRLDGPEYGGRSNAVTRRTTSHYSLWNMFIICSGGFFTLGNGLKQTPFYRNSLFLKCVTSDLHSIFFCQRCQRGYESKMFDISNAASTWTNPESLELALAAIVAKDISLFYTVLETIKATKISQQNPEEYVCLLVRQILTAVQSGAKTMSHCDMDKAVTTLDQRDASLKVMAKQDASLYRSVCLDMFKASKAFSFIAMYCVYYAAAVAATDISNGKDVGSPVDTVVPPLLPNIMSFPSPPNLHPRELDVQTSKYVLLVFVWALRNAVRMGRDVTDESNSILCPGTPLALRTIMTDTSHGDLLSNSVLDPSSMACRQLVNSFLSDFESNNDIVTNYRVAQLNRPVPTVNQSGKV